MEHFAFDDGYKALFFGMAVYVVCLVIRRGLEFFLPSLKGGTKVSSIWQHFILPTMPVLLGGVAGALIQSFPYPDGLNTRPLHAMYGLVCGFAAGWAYRVIKSVIEKRWNVVLPGEPSDKLEDLLHGMNAHQLMDARNKATSLLLKATPTGNAER